VKIDITAISARLKEARETAGYSVKDAAAKMSISEAEYAALETDKDVKLSLLSEAAAIFGADLAAILTGDEPRLKQYEVTKNGGGLPIERRAGFNYRHYAPFFKGRKLEPIYVTAPENKTPDVELQKSTHAGQEWDFIIKGQLKVIIGNNTELLSAGDGIYYDSATPHAMAAVGGDCEFLAVLIN
jgi:transcriptional regulator with XRE-family HTH domain